MADLAGRDWNSIVTYEFQYHKSCYRDYTRNEHTSIDGEDAAFLDLCEWVDEKLHIKEIVTKSEALNMYNIESGKELKDSRPIINKIVEHFNGDVAIWKPPYGKHFLYKTAWSVGEMIVHFTRKLTAMHCEIENMKESPKQEETVKAAARFLRNEVKKAPRTYVGWPPKAASLLRRKTKLPKLTTIFLTNLLSARKNRCSKRRKAIINSIGQDIIYNVTNAKHKTSKHVLLSLCTKRRTGSKRLINWLNKFGHGISYDETLFVETTLAKDEVENQETRSYCPSILEAMRYKIFFIDLFS